MCNMTRVHKDLSAIWHECQTQHLIYRKFLTQKIYFILAGMGQNFFNKIKMLFEQTH